jgi:hypothetical protein
MHVHETVILPLPRRVQEIRAAAALYGEQYHVRVQIQVRGHVQCEHGIQYEIPRWHTLGDVDPELDLLGLGEPGADWDQLVWVIPSGPGEIRFSPLSMPL